MTVSLPPSTVPVWSCSVGGGAEWKERGRGGGNGGVDKIISRLIQRHYGAECAGAPAELSIQSPPPAGVKGGKEVPCLEEINLPARLSLQSHHTAGGKKTRWRSLSSSWRTLPPPARFVLGRLCGHLSGLRPPFRGVGVKDVCAGFVCGGHLRAPLYHPPSPLETKC